ncbi:Ethanolamine utilization protein EutN/carboxysome structural protein Ccml [Acididesulfobacillus acetoxydans]|uniref:Ethanolamine utilisation protein EutN/carboxysome n=1 Tax=Acididesulfobacillus acetoxydans TaxID=1561005 RepID=A0A8S0WFS0_9FIRM|nr:EutN/CcmL family microcompartment protein [Acididesulfobacillus acetoxydans]CAA7601302.1 Ethanolamine utilization protein EutN/carboxysome structural protein Ccml [Acididesulfobacillus acetoxydans]CEJ08788.1 Ethanolamine utilisation protein EutN/carboxysome [Acididesulfobacillus acetoxydans]
MMVGRVIGTVVATRKSDALVGQKLLVLQPLHSSREQDPSLAQGAALPDIPVQDVPMQGGPVENAFPPDAVVAVDTVGAGVGETVLVALGSAARKALSRPEAPVDAAIVGIVDSIRIAGREQG